MNSPPQTPSPLVTDTIRITAPDRLTTFHQYEIDTKPKTGQALGALGKSVPGRGSISQLMRTVMRNAADAKTTLSPNAERRLADQRRQLRAQGASRNASMRH